MRRVLLYAATLLIAIPVAGATYQAIACARDRTAHPPRGVLVDVGGRKMHLVCSGPPAGGGPTVILEHGLTGGWSLGWADMQPLVAKTTRVCSYDRAGYGYSDPAPGPRTSTPIAEELHALLAAADVKPPYVMVGHSFGGYTVPIFTIRHRADVAAVVLVDPSDLAPVPAADLAEAEEYGRHCARHEWLARLGARRLLCLDDSCTPRKGHPEETTRAILAQGFTSAFARTECEENTGFFPSETELAHAGTMGDVPTIVLAAGKNDDQSNGATAQEWASRQAATRDMCKLSTRCTVLVAEHANHRIPEEEPAAVVDAITRAVASASSAGLPAGAAAPR